MADDALSMWQNARPRPPASFPPARFDHERLSPASPSYRSMIPPPPCTACGEDHHPGKAYNHKYQSEIDSVSGLVEAAQAAPLPTGTAGAEVPGTSRAVTQRVAVYNGRGDDFVVAVEAAPDWDTVESWKLDPPTVLKLTLVLHALEVKVQDKTGGELATLRAEMH